MTTAARDAVGLARNYKVQIKQMQCEVKKNMENTNNQPKTRSKRKLSTLLLVGVIIAAVAIAGVVIALTVNSSLTANLGTTTVNPTTPPTTPTPTPQVSNDIITAASYNGNSPTSGIGTTSVQFPDSAMNVGDVTTLSITVTNNGNTASAMNTTPSISGVGTDGSVLAFTQNFGSTTIPANGGTATFTWTVTANAAGDATPVVTISAS
jgi:ABC-type phosphate/phosphonate transport system permease subunit